MSQTLLDVADAIASELGAWSAVRGYDTTSKLEDLSTRRVDVVPVESVPTRLARGLVADACTCDVGVRYRFGAADQDAASGKITTAAMDALLVTFGTLVDWFLASTRLATLPGAAFKTLAVRAYWVPDHFSAWRQYTGILRVTYQVTRQD